MSRSYKTNRRVLGWRTKRRYPKYIRLGPGGWGCPCCAPAPGKRTEAMRVAKRKDKREAFKIEETANGHD